MIQRPGVLIPREHCGELLQALAAWQRALPRSSPFLASLVNDLLQEAAAADGATGDCPDLAAWWTTSQYCQEAGCNRRTATNRAQQGLVTARKVNGRWLYKPLTVAPKH